MNKGYLIGLCIIGIVGIIRTILEFKRISNLEEIDSER